MELGMVLCMEELSHPEAQKLLEAVRSQIETVIRGKRDVIDKVIVTLLAGGHLLVEDLPGMGKTTLAYSLACSLDADFTRIQFTSDLLPADILGVSIYEENRKQFKFHRGPVFTNILLADEINRSTPKTQSALLEVMDRRRISVEGQSHEVGNPYMVFATQNPVDYEGTFPLPDSQMDRFFMRLQMGYPDIEHEREILKRGLRHYDDIPLEPVLNQAQLIELQSLAQRVFIEDSVLDYMLKLVRKTREHPDLKSGISPRGVLALKTAVQCKAFYEGRNYVLPSDVQQLLEPVCGHRLRLFSQGSDSLENHRNIRDLLLELGESMPPDIS